MHANVLHFYTPSTPVRGQKVKRFFFFEKGYVAYQSHYAIKMFDPMHTPDLLGWVKKIRH